MTTAIQEYTATEAALATLAERYKGVVFDVTKVEDMLAAKDARREIRNYRVALEKMRVTLKADVLERGRQIDGEAKRITAALESLENPIDEQIKKEEQRKEDIRLAAERALQEKMAAEERARREAEEAKMAAERAEIARRQAALDAAEEERKQLEADLTKKIEEARREARMKIEEEERQARMAREEADRVARQQRQAADEMARAKLEEEAEAARKAHAAEDARLAAERRRLEDAQRQEREAEEARQKAERAAKDAKERELKRIAVEHLDGVALLENFVGRFGVLKNFAPVVRDIRKFLNSIKEKA